MNAYVEGLNMLLEANHQDHEYSKIESLLMQVVEECAKDTDDKSISEAMGTASNKFETAINHAWKLMYLIPMFAIEDKPEKWTIVENSPLIGKDFRVCNTRKVHVDMIERHVDTVDGTPGCVYRINANSKLAFMLYGNSVVEYETKDGENMDLKNNYSCACFVNQFPFVIPYPTVTTIIHVKTDGEEEFEDYGFISDIRNISREEVSAEDLHGHFFSPTGTALYPTLTEEELEQFQLVNGQPAEVTPVEEAAEETEADVEETATMIDEPSFEGKDDPSFEGEPDHN